MYDNNKDKSAYDIDELALRIKCLELTKTSTVHPSISLAKEYYRFITGNHYAPEFTTLENSVN